MNNLHEPQTLSDKVELCLDIEARYQRASTFIQGSYTKTLVRNDLLYPHWIEGTEYFWYERSYRIEEPSELKESLVKEGEEFLVVIGKEFRLVDAKTTTNKTAFDHTTLAEALTQVSGQVVDKDDLPFHFMALTLCALSRNTLTVSFAAFDQQWRYDCASNVCEVLNAPIISFTEPLSPNGKYFAFARDHNLWTRDAISGEELQLTFDGDEEYAYGAASTSLGLVLAPEPAAFWSPDSTRLLVMQRDKRRVNTLPEVTHVPLDGSIRPTLKECKAAYPGDAHVEGFRLLSLDTSSGKICAADYHTMQTGWNQNLGYFGANAWWAKDSRQCYFVDVERGDQIVRLVAFDTHTGETQVVFEETSKTYVNVFTNYSTRYIHSYLADSNELIWWSERSGWGHLYLYDLTTGDLTKSITLVDASREVNNEWLVREVLQVDERRREILIQTSGRVPGRDPYYRDICRVNIDTGELVSVFSTDEEVVVHYPQSVAIYTEEMCGRANALTGGVSPSGDYIVATRSRVDQVPVSFLLNREGEILLELEVADLHDVPSNWRWPEPVQVKAADGVTDLYGVLFRPSDFSPDQKYPVINYINGGPWSLTAPKASFHAAYTYADRIYLFAAALAELGFIVLTLDSRGTPLRSKDFQDESYGWIPSAGNTDDHVSAIQQLTKRYPYMDLERVGIFAPAYRSGLQNFLERQDLYKVCVQMMLFDNRMHIATFDSDRYEGCEGPDDDKLYAEHLVDNLRGKLLLMHVMNSVLSPSCAPAGTFRVIDALQKANKDFDLLILPYADNTIVNSYMFRRACDYLVKNLQGIEPPKAFLFQESRTNIIPD